MKIVLLGAPGSGKRLFADEWIRRYGYMAQGDVRSWSGGFDFALGPLADYRVEMFLLSRRVVETMNPPHTNTISITSLLDSYLYIVRRLEIVSEMGEQFATDMKKWWLLAELAGQILQDTFNPDLIFYLPGNKGDDCAQRIEQLVLLSIDSGLEVHVLDGDTLTKVQKGATLVSQYEEARRARESGASTDPGSPIEQDRAEMGSDTRELPGN
jgi:hypothetical protein